MRHIALLRGINVGGKAKLPMKDLVSAFQAAGADAIQTYIQSGNVLFEAGDPAAVATAVTAEIGRRFGYPGRIVLRTADELARCFAGNPFLEAGLAAESLHVSFLADLPSPAAVKGLDPERSPGDLYVIRGRDIYLYLPQGMARTRLTSAYFDGKLKTVGTVRNWNTVSRLVALATAPSTGLTP